MERKTSESYKKEILKKYKSEKGGEMSMYLTQPTRKQIREACLELLDKRNSKDDEKTLSRFFNFEDGKSKSLIIQQTKGHNGDIYKPVINFLIGETSNTSIENLELISWLIDFKPRPLFVYLKSNTSSHDEPKQSEFKKYREKYIEEKVVNKVMSNNEKVKSKKYYIEIIITVVALLFLFLFIDSKILYNDKLFDSSPKCIVWVKSQYKETSCDIQFNKESGMKPQMYDKKLLKNFRKVEVSLSYEFFINNDPKRPRVWYYKNNKGEIEYFTSPGLHPVNGVTLKKVTQHIIDTYVPKHIYKSNSFLSEDIPLKY